MFLDLIIGSRCSPLLILKFTRILPKLESELAVILLQDISDKCPKVIQQMFSYFMRIYLPLIQLKETLLSRLETRFSVVTFTFVFA